MSKIFLVLFIIGITLLGIGSAVLVHYAGTMEEKYSDMVIFFDGELKQAQLSSTPIDLLRGDELTITILGPAERIFFSLTGPDNSTLHETIFSDVLSHQFVAKSNGTYFMNVGNMDTQTINVMGLLTEKPVSDNEFILSIGSSMLAASFIILIGVMIVFVSIIILVLKKFRSKNNSKQISK
jgi:uncharacterized membrane protein